MSAVGSHCLHPSPSGVWCSERRPRDARGEVVPETFVFVDRMPVTEPGKPDRIAVTALAQG